MPVPLCSIRRSPGCAEWTLRANSSPRQSAVQSTKFSTCRLTVPTILCRLRHVAHVAPSRCASREKRPVSADCPTCTRSNAGAVRYPIPRNSEPARWRDTDLFRLFSKQARECRRLATLAQDSEDRSFWLRLSEHWLKLAQGLVSRQAEPLTQLTTGALQVGLKGTMNALDLTDRRQKMWRGLERQSGHFHTLGVACI